MESTLIPEVEVSEIEGYKAAGVIAGGMLPKIEGMADAIYQGVHEAVIIDGRVPTRFCWKCSVTEAQVQCSIGGGTADSKGFPYGGKALAHDKKGVYRIEYRSDFPG